MSQVAGSRLDDIKCLQEGLRVHAGVLSDRGLRHVPEYVVILFGIGVDCRGAGAYPQRPGVTGIGHSGARCTS